MGNMGSKCNILFEMPKGTFLPETTLFDVLIVKICAAGLAVRCIYIRRLGDINVKACACDSL